MLLCGVPLRGWITGSRMFTRALPVNTPLDEAEGRSEQLVGLGVYLLGVEAHVVGQAEGSSMSSAASPARPERATASTSQNEQARKAPSRPARPSSPE